MRFLNCAAQLFRASQSIFELAARVFVYVVVLVGLC